MEQLAAAHPELFIEFIAVPHLSPAHIARLALCCATLRLVSAHDTYWRARFDATLWSLAPLPTTGAVLAECAPPHPSISVLRLPAHPCAGAQGRVRARRRLSRSSARAARIGRMACPRRRWENGDEKHADLAALSVRALKQELRARGRSSVGMLEKSEFRDALRVKEAPERNAYIVILSRPRRAREEGRA